MQNENLHPRRAVVSLKKINPTETSRDTAFSLVWTILREQTFFAHKNVPKPFTFYLEQYPMHEYILTFSSILPEITTFFIDHCKAFKGQTIAVDQDNLFCITDVYPIADLGYIGPFMRLKSVSGLYVSKNKKIREMKEAGIWEKSLISHLIGRVQTFLHEDVSCDEIKVKLISLDAVKPVRFKTGSCIPAQFVQIRLTAPSIIIETALYGGLGVHTGSGFGMVVPC
jgi:hypothetical protein